MTPLAGFYQTRVGVLGMGRSGLAAARALEAASAFVVCGDDGEAGRAAAEAAGFVVGDLADPEEAALLDLLVVSPGVPHLYPTPHPAVAAAAAAGAPIDNDIGLFLAELKRRAEVRDRSSWPRLARPPAPPPRAVCVTGSNGKSTTTALIHHLLGASGVKTQMGGNIGRAVFDLDDPSDGETVVLELSSYQTDLAATLDCTAALFLNLTPDHLDRHGGMGGYFAAKRRLFDLGRPRRAVIGVDEPEGRILAQQLWRAPFAHETVAVSVERTLRAPHPAVYVEAGRLVEWTGFKELHDLDLSGFESVRGAHNHQNAAAAYAVLRGLGAAPETIAAGLASFAGLPHRLQRVAEKDGVVFVNDSKATNADAAEKALLAYPRVRWIAGGRAKAGGVEALRPLFGRIAKAYLIGEAAEAFAATLDGAAAYEIAGDMETAVARAAAEAEPGEAVLLAPACASFDQYPDFEKRGDAFVAAVQRTIVG